MPFFVSKYRSEIFGSVYVFFAAGWAQQRLLFDWIGNYQLIFMASIVLSVAANAFPYAGVLPQFTQLTGMPGGRLTEETSVVAAEL